MTNVPNLTPKIPHFPQNGQKETLCNPYHESTQMVQIGVPYTHSNEQLAIIANYPPILPIEAPLAAKGEFQDGRQNGRRALSASL